jgi:methionine synthase I (cobalamin-dependent)
LTQSERGEEAWRGRAASVDADDQAAFELGCILAGDDDAPLAFAGTMAEPLSRQAGAEDVAAAAWLVDEPETVSHIHELYRYAGADVALTATAQATAPALGRAGVHVDVGTVVASALRCARSGGPRFVMGEVGPCGIRERGAARAAYAELVGALAPGVHAIMVSSMASALDARTALDACREAAPDLPVCVSLTCDAEGCLGYGEPLAQTFSALASAGADAVGVDGVPADVLARLAPAVVDAAHEAHVRVVCRPSAGAVEGVEDGHPSWPLGDADVEACLRALWDAGVRLLGTGDGVSYGATCAVADVVAGL